MNELIKIQEINGNKAVSARELHQFLEAGSNVNTWFNNQAERAMLVENEDFVRFHKSESEGRGGQNKVDYALTLSAAKEISRLNGGDKGKQARTYFISCERKLQEIAKPMSTLDLLEMSIKQLREQEQRVSIIESDVRELKADRNTRSDYFTIVGYAVLNDIKIGLKQAANLGRKASRICNDNGYEMESIPDPRFGRVRMYPISVLDEVFEIENLIF